MANQYKHMLAQGSHALAGAGLYRSGHIARAMSHVSVGSNMAGPEAAEALGAAMTGVGAGLVALLVTVKLVSAAFDAVGKTAMEFVGAIAQIGGAKGLQSMIVESATSERLSANIAANAADKVSQKTVEDVLQKISSSSEFTKEEASTMARSFLGKRGSFSEFEQLQDFIPNLASVATLSPEQAGSVVGQLRVQFPELSIDKTKEAAMSLWSAGKAGAVELKDTQSITQALGFARAVSPNVLAGLNLEMGMVQLAQRYTGGQSAAEAVTGVRRLQEQLLSDPTSRKGRAIQSILGADYLTHDESGRAVLRNAPESMARVALGAFEDKPGYSQAFEARSMKAIRGFVAGDVADQFVGKSEQEKVDILTNVFRKMEETGSHLEEFNGALTVVKDTAEYQLKQAFNQLANELESEIIKVLPQLTAAAKGFVHWMVENKDLMGAAMKDFISAIIKAGEILPALGTIILYVVQVMAQAMKVLADINDITFGDSKMFDRSVIDSVLNYDPAEEKKKADAQAQAILTGVKVGNVAVTTLHRPEAAEGPSTYQNLPGAHKDAHPTSDAQHAKDLIAQMDKYWSANSPIAKKLDTVIQNTQVRPQPPSTTH
jgi:hypothetical protein